MIVDGKKIAEEIFSEIKKQIERLGRPPRLTVFTCAPNFETKKFLAIKKKKSEEVGMKLSVVELLPRVDEKVCIEKIEEATKTSDGIVIQLPFPVHIRSEVLINVIPVTHDADALRLSDPEILPPVVGAMQEILIREQVNIGGKNVVIIGRGRLVGAPAEAWFKKEEATVTVLTKEASDISSYTKNADVIVLGAGVPGLLKPEMVKDGAVILDAGTSEEGGMLRGDADPVCAEKASLFTPVPGGIGPITVALLLQNVVVLASRKL